MKQVNRNMTMIGSAVAVLMGQGCAVVADAAVTVVATVVKTGVKVTGAVIDAAIPDSKDKK